MDTTLYVISMQDGTVALMQTVDGATPEACLEKWPPEHRARVSGVPVKVNPAVVPQDRTFRDAWILFGKTVIHDLGKAREIHRNRLRNARQSRLAALDVAYIRASETGDKDEISAILAEKTALRDVTDREEIAAARSVSELRVLTLDTLVPRVDSAAELG